MTYQSLHLHIVNQAQKGCAHFLTRHIYVTWLGVLLGLPPLLVLVVGAVSVILFACICVMFGAGDVLIDSMRYLYAVLIQS